MGRPSNPRLMARVLEAVKHLGEAKGSSARQVLELLREGNKTPTRNLAMQVQRALKNAVTAGLLQLRSGRYKMLISLQDGVRNRGGKGNSNKNSVSKPGAGKKKEDIENAKDSASLQPLQAGPKSRCSHCKKHKRRASRRRRKRSTKRRRRPTKQASERKSRKLRRQGDEEVSNRRERRRKMAAPSARSKSKLPDGKTNSNQNEGDETTESPSRRRSESSLDTEGEEDEPKTTKAELSCSTGRRNGSSSRRSVSSKPRRSSRKQNSSLNKTKTGENGCEDIRMECCDDGGEDIVEENVNDKRSEENGGSSTSI